MTSQPSEFPLQGYLLLRTTGKVNYRGVDRQPFCIDILLDELVPGAVNTSNKIWTWYPPGWRRDAYHIYEETRVTDADESIELLPDLKTASHVQAIIEPHLGPHETVYCSISTTDGEYGARSRGQPGLFLGYDIAYLGGDFFSAIKGGLFYNPFCSPSPSLQAQFHSRLTEFGLLADARDIEDYLTKFKRAVQTEAESEFHVYELWTEQ